MSLIDIIEREKSNMKKYTKTHEWVNIENGEVGITENAIELLGDIVFLELPDVGKEFSKDSHIAVVESIHSKAIELIKNNKHFSFELIENIKEDNLINKLKK